MIPLLLSVAFFPALAALDPPLTFTEEGQAIHQLLRGSGPPVARGDVVTIEFTVRDEKGRELASTTRRGMPYTLAAFPGDDPFLVPALLGMRAGGARTVYMPRGTYPTSTVAGVTLFGTDLVLLIRLLEVVKPGQR